MSIKHQLSQLSDFDLIDLAAWVGHELDSRREAHRQAVERIKAPLVRLGQGDYIVDIDIGDL